MILFSSLAHWIAEWHLKWRNWGYNDMVDTIIWWNWQNIKVELDVIMENLGIFHTNWWLCASRLVWLVWYCDKGQYRVHNDKGIEWFMVPIRCTELLLPHPSRDGLCLEVVFLFVRIRQLLKFCNYIGNFAVGLLNGLNGLNVHYLLTTVTDIVCQCKI